MKKDEMKKTILVSLSVCALGAFAADIPFCAIRLRKPQTDRRDVWASTLEQFAKYREGVDEVWFSTGICFPKMEEHRIAAKCLADDANELRKLGILPSIQIQATIGHGESLTRYADNSGRTWQGYVAEDGTESKAMNCPRAPGFLAYLAEMSSIYASALKPYSVWVDDDIRIVNHHPKGGSSGIGCHCDACVAAFAKEEGKEMTRKTLVAAMKSDAALASKWRAFSFRGEAGIARTIAEAVHAASPETRVCQQQPGMCFPEHQLLYKAYHEATGLPVGMRPGAGAYYDHDPRVQIGKAYYLAQQIDTIGPLPCIDRICNEIETCPRSFSCRSGRGILLEALEALSQGMNSISVLAIDAGFETPEWYGSEILSALASNSAMLKRYVKINNGAVRTGYGVFRSPHTAQQTCSLPLMPLIKGAVSQLARLVTSEQMATIAKAGEEEIEKLLKEDLLLEGGAAQILVERGFGEHIGISRCTKLLGAVRERFTEAYVNEGFLARETPVSGAAYVLEPLKTARVFSEYYSDANADFRPGASSVCFKTPDGRRRVVFGHDALTSALRIASGDRLVQLHRLADWASHGRCPVLLETPVRSFVQPQVRTDGSLASVAFVNASIGRSAPVKMRLRGVKGATAAIWSSFDSPDVKLPVKYDDGDALVTLPAIEGWTGGYLFFE